VFRSQDETDLTLHETSSSKEIEGGIMNFILKFLPADKRALLELALRITSSLDTAEERKAVADYGIKMLEDGKVNVGEWAKFGSKLGILTGKH
tara:strand:+ start:113 stop:391 length:279 start_codon:yes stop_codon:yes gene_type:complete